MINRYNIKNIDDLKSTQSLLKSQYIRQGHLIKKDFGLYIRSFSFSSVFLRKHPARKLSGIAKSALPANVVSSLIPVLLNKTIFRNSGWLKKLAVYAAAKVIGNKIK
ncbi:hypothetical protein [Pedobacter hartonius]|uniref:Uncharacterized protein n=1 Tax=Pedobacter hartonius TaxID=425514 RepID=A0A1H4G6U0_9SPHI|nr:hypothetical protein [Pedobacter hartonius]SEB05264.1 hypothetical protein SAMN05443550_10976 [Pedobacter hartonius]